ncbi:MAG: hypothetical protein WBA57_27740 [Elainellaceae cyanobacterium]
MVIQSVDEGTTQRIPAQSDRHVIVQGRYGYRGDTGYAQTSS